MRKLFILLTLTFYLFGLFPSHSVLGATKGRFFFERTGHVFWEINTREKIVALTFDDGPDPEYTPQILDVLKKYHAKATFFVIGAHAKEHPQIIKRQIRDGHEVANHTFNHDYDLHISKRRLRSELLKTSKTIYKISGTRPVLFRPVGGYYNELIINTALENNFNTIMWSWHQDTKDWSRPGVDKIVHNVISDTKPGDIILMHDAGGNRSQTVKALDEILETLTNAGYECVTVSEMLFRLKSNLP